MDTTTQRELARRFRALHDPAAPLALANAWDPASARVAAAAGSPAIATTSAGVAWAVGAPDGDRVERDVALAQLARVAAAVPGLPVTADIEAGFGATAAQVGDTVALVLAIGAVGVNIEDARRDAEPGAELRPIAEQAERLAAARAAADAAGVELYINARIDVFLRSVGPATGRVADVLGRARAYLEAGASGIFVPGTTDPAVIAELAAGIDAPLNILAGPGAPSVTELGKLGVARVSIGAGIAEAAYGVVQRATRELLESGTYESVREAVEYRRMNALMAADAPSADAPSTGGA
jgi:2-methylisocitrate lyase-like PEP mutase family enzyme